MRHEDAMELHAHRVERRVEIDRRRQQPRRKEDVLVGVRSSAETAVKVNVVDRLVVLFATTEPTLEDVRGILATVEIFDRVIPGGDRG
jgi:hypothetical protein